MLNPDTVASIKPGRSVLDRCAADLGRLMRAVHSDDAAAARFFQLVRPHLGDRALSDPPAWSCVCDDGSPYELSVATRADGRASVRLLVEAHSAKASATGYWNQALSLNEVLARESIVDLTGFEALRDLFEPRDPHAYYACYHGFEFEPQGKPLGKVYLNPAARGIKSARLIIGEAAQRLGVSAAWANLERRLPPDAGLILLSLDLVDIPRSRFKVYARIFNATPRRLAELCGVGGDSAEPGVAEFVEIISGQPEVLASRPVFVVFHLRPDTAQPVRAVVDVPFLPYAHNDALAHQRTRNLFERFAVPADAYLRAVNALAPGALDRSVALHSYASFQRDPGGPRLTVYFCPVLYGRRYGLFATKPGPNFWNEPVA